MNDQKKVKTYYQFVRPLSNYRIAKALRAHGRPQNRSKKTQTCQVLPFKIPDKFSGDRA